MTVSSAAGASSQALATPSRSDFYLQRPIEKYSPDVLQRMQEDLSCGEVSPLIASPLTRIMQIVGTVIPRIQELHKYIETFRDHPDQDGKRIELVGPVLKKFQDANSLLARCYDDLDVFGMSIRERSEESNDKTILFDSEGRAIAVDFVQSPGKSIISFAQWEREDFTEECQGLARHIAFALQAMIINNGVFYLNRERLNIRDSTQFTTVDVEMFKYVPKKTSEDAPPCQPDQEVYLSNGEEAEVEVVYDDSSSDDEDERDGVSAASGAIVAGSEPRSRTYVRTTETAMGQTYQVTEGRLKYDSIMPCDIIGYDDLGFYMEEVHSKIQNIADGVDVFVRGFLTPGGESRIITYDELSRLYHLMTLIQDQCMNIDDIILKDINEKVYSFGLGVERFDQVKFHTLVRTSKVISDLLKLTDKLLPIQSSGPDGQIELQPLLSRLDLAWKEIKERNEVISQNIAIVQKNMSLARASDTLALESGHQPDSAVSDLFNSLVPPPVRSRDVITGSSLLYPAVFPSIPTDRVSFIIEGNALENGTFEVRGTGQEMAWNNDKFNPVVIRPDGSLKAELPSTAEGESFEWKIVFVPNDGSAERWQEGDNMSSDVFKSRLPITVRIQG